MESQGKMLVALSLIAVLSGLSAITYVGVQRNANLISKAAPAAPSTSNLPAPDAAGSAGSATGSSPITSTGTTSGSGLITCTTNQDCIDFATAHGMCNAGSPCTPGGGSFDCVAGNCIVSGISTSASGSNGSTKTGLSGAESAPTCGTQSGGDFDCNGKAECADLSLFVKEFTGKVATKNSDVTKDGKVSLADFETGRAVVSADIAGTGGVWATCQL